MSMVATINVTVKSLDLLQRALGLLHYRILVDLADERGVLRGRVQHADTGRILAELQRDMDGAYRITNQAMQRDIISQVTAVRGSFEETNREILGEINTIQQTYSYLQVLESVRLENYQVTGTETKNGRIVLTVAV